MYLSFLEVGLPQQAHFPSHSQPLNEDGFYVYSPFGPLDEDGFYVYSPL